VNNDTLSMLSYTLHREAGQDKVSAVSKFYSFFFCPFFFSQKEANL